MFIAALFTIGKTQKHPKCLRAAEQIKTRYIYRVEQYTAIIGKERLPFAAKTLSEFKSDRERQVSYDST